MSNPTKPVTPVNAIEGLGENPVEFRSPISFLNAEDAQTFADSLQDQGALPSATLAEATEVEMQAGSEVGLRSMSPLRIAEAIAALAPLGSDLAPFLAHSPLFLWDAIAAPQQTEGTNVTSITDLAGNGITLNSGTVKQVWRVGAVNGFPAIDSNGGDALTSTGNVTIAGSFTVFCVVKCYSFPDGFGTPFLTLNLGSNPSLYLYFSESGLAGGDQFVGLYTDATGGGWPTGVGRLKSYTGSAKSYATVIAYVFDTNAPYSDASPYTVSVYINGAFASSRSVSSPAPSITGLLAYGNTYGSGTNARYLNSHLGVYGSAFTGAQVKGMSGLLLRRFGFNTGKRVYLVGDSLIQGAHASIGLELVTQLQGAFPWLDFEYLCIDGTPFSFWTTGGGPTSLPFVTALNTPGEGDQVIMMGGANDINGNLDGGATVPSAATLQTAWSNMISAFQKNGAKVTLITLPSTASANIGMANQTNTEAARADANAAAVAGSLATNPDSLIDLSTLTVSMVAVLSDPDAYTNDDYFYSDGVHLLDAAYALMFPALKASVQANAGF